MDKPTRHRTNLIRTLAPLLLQDRPWYGRELATAATAATGSEVRSSSVYMALQRFEEDGWVSAEWDHSGRPRKYYRVTDDGRTEFEDITKETNR